MTVYKNIKGDPIETVATDPSNPIEGDIWYNTTSGIIKGLGFRAAAWASGANLNTGRQRAGSAGTAQTAALAFGGFEAPPNGPPLGETETYNGTSWSEGPDLNTSRGNTSGSGTTTAAWCGAGRGTPSGPFVQNTEEYDGSSWTNSNTSNSSDAAIRSCSGTQTAGLMAGGFAPPSNNPIEHNNNVEEYNGTSWTNVTVLPQYQAYNCQAGTQTATINGGGNAGSTAPSVSDNAISLEYDVTNWTTGPNANIAPAKFDAYQGGFGTQTSAIFVGGSSTTTAAYDGTTFATSTSLPGARPDTQSATNSPSTDGLLFGGYPVPAAGTTTIELTGDGTETKTVTTST